MFSFGGVDVEYGEADGSAYIYRMTATAPGPQTWAASRWGTRRTM